MKKLTAMLAIIMLSGCMIDRNGTFEVEYTIYYGQYREINTELNITYKVKCGNFGGFEVTDPYRHLDIVNQLLVFSNDKEAFRDAIHEDADSICN